jgi:basic amino acid/polyamine antiporter, APA family
MVANATAIASTPAPRGLCRVLGLAFGMAIVVGGTVGTGILRTPGPVAGMLGSAGLIYVVWLLAGVYALIATNVYAELASSVPLAGGPYVFVRRGLGEFPGFVAGWSDFASNMLAISYAAVASSEFIAQLFPVLARREHLLAAALIIVLTTVNSLGVKAGSGLQQALTLLKVILLLGLVAAAFAHSGNSPVSMTRSQPHSLSATAVAVVVSVQLVLGTYSGYNCSCYFAEELTDPGRNVPRSLFVGTAAVILIYLAINAALLHVLSPAQLATSTLPAADALATLYGPVARAAITVIAIACALALLHGELLLTPRVLYGMSRDRLFGRPGTYVTRAGVPLIALWVSAALAVVFTELGKFETLFAIGGSLALLLDPMCAAALFMLRRREPALARPFRAIGFPWLPGLVLVLGSALFLAYIVANPTSTLIACALLAVAFPLFRFGQSALVKSKRADQSA